MFRIHLPDHAPGEIRSALTWSLTQHQGVSLPPLPTALQMEKLPGLVLKMLQDLALPCTTSATPDVRGFAHTAPFPRTYGRCSSPGVCTHASEPISAVSSSQPLRQGQPPPSSASVPCSPLNPAGTAHNCPDSACLPCQTPSLLRAESWANIPGHRGPTQACHGRLCSDHAAAVPTTSANEFQPRAPPCQEEWVATGAASQSWAVYSGDNLVFPEADDAIPVHLRITLCLPNDTSYPLTAAIISLPR